MCDCSSGEMCACCMIILTCCGSTVNNFVRLYILSRALLFLDPATFFLKGVINIPGINL